ncbi:hypothetical protein BASA61_006343 [Batrachochytrium salamandrivorans]|nr:hypothetical protein BASA60_010421 [Batrachochytrium salamandrivorans]KAH6587279.1 hypothetical protein BASA61_006343 [Batrachochytrium salamandrivorans]KAH9256743.1 hypothetical protein BASA81_005037 [Batrachochytrium salamandrivorans]
MFDPLLWVLPHFITPHYAGQTTQGNTNEGDDVDQASDFNSKPNKIPRLLQETNPTAPPTALQESDTSDQSDASSLADLRLEEERRNRDWLLNVFRTRTQSLPEPEPPALPDFPRFGTTPPVCLRGAEAELYRQNQNTDEYNAFTASEVKYLESEYSIKEVIDRGHYGVTYRAVRKSDGRSVAYKSIRKLSVSLYALESSPSLICYLRDSLVYSNKPSVEQFLPSRPSNLLIPWELAVQMHLSQPGRENPHIQKAFDYAVLEDEYVLIMELLDKQWETFSIFVDKNIRIDIEHARDITRKVVEVMVSLKKQGVVSTDIQTGNVVRNTETRQVKFLGLDRSGIVPGWKEEDSSESSDSPSPDSEYEIGFDELLSVQSLGNFLYTLITLLFSTSIAHLVVECEQVTGHRIQSGLVPAIQKSRLRLLGRALDPGVENVYTWLRGGVLNGEADLDQQWLDGTVEHESMGTRHDNRALDSNG